MKCEKAMDLIFAYHGEEAPLLVHLQTGVHLFFCPDCSRTYERLEASREILGEDFFPPAPDLEESIMRQVAAEDSGIFETNDAPAPVLPGGLSTRGWVIAGLIILVSLASAFIGMEFNSLAHSAGMSFLLPVGITIGIVLTSYGALFIGSHLKELREKFGL